MCVFDKPCLIKNKCKYAQLRQSHYGTTHQENIDVNINELSSNALQMELQQLLMNVIKEQRLLTQPMTVTQLKLALGDRNVEFENRKRKEYYALLLRVTRK